MANLGDPWLRCRRGSQKVTVLLKQIEIAAINEPWRANLNTVNQPSSASVGISKLPIASSVPNRARASPITRLLILRQRRMAEAGIIACHRRGR